MRYAMIVDTKKCVGCQACVVSCIAENRLPDGHVRDWVDTVTHGDIPELRLQIFSERCHHCGNPPCVACCPTGASHVAEGGVVLVAHEKCTGCKACIASCPYSARFLHPEGYADKCTFCIHRVREGQEPACVATCPTSCMRFFDLERPDDTSRRLLATRRVRTLLPAAGTRPNLFFLE